jgi:GxxExxY protein
MGLLHSDITGQVIKSFYEVYNSLGYGFLEKVYENALAFELRQAGLHIEQQRPITVRYKEIAVGEYFADIYINDSILLELKTAESISAAHEAQILNYLKATGVELGMLLNFGPTPQYKRKIKTDPTRSLLSVLLDP